MIGIQKEKKNSTWENPFFTALGPGEVNTAEVAPKRESFKLQYWLCMEHL